MKDEEISPGSDLRKKAESLLSKKKSSGEFPLNAADREKLIHELQVHQIELEMQNEELLAARNLAETALSKYTELYDFAPVGYFTLDYEGVILNLNLAGASLLGLERSRISGKNFKLTVLPDDRAAFSDFLQKVLEGSIGKACEVRLTDNGGATLWVNIKGAVLETCDSIILAVSDITMRKQAEEALNVSNLRNAALLEAMPEMMFVMTRDGTFVDFKAEATDQLAIPPAEIIGKNMAETGFSKTQLEAILQTISATLETGLLNIIEYELATPAGLNYFEARMVPFGIDKVLSTVRNITARKQMEEERMNLERQLYQAQKLESLGILAGGIAHDFNNILMAIMGNAELGMINVSDVSPARPFFENINNASIRAASLCRQMLAYSGKGRFVIQTVDLCEVVEEMGHMLEVLLTKKTILKYDLVKGLPSIAADATQIQQVIMNLIINASEAIGEKSGAISIKTYVVECDRKYLKAARLQDDLSEGKYVCLEVTDTGCGMDDETMSKIFDPFFSTKFTGRGLGLSAVQGIIRGHKGAISIKSVQDEGSTFRVLFPAVERIAEDAAKKMTDVSHEGGFKFAGSVLLVDDEEAIRSLAGKILEGMGLNVLSAADGREALKVFRAHEEDIKCVILDLTMPQMDGEEAFRELRLIKPDLLIIMSSGYNEQEVVSCFTGKNLSGFIQKPYTIQSLGEVLKKVLDK